MGPVLIKHFIWFKSLRCAAIFLRPVIKAWRRFGHRKRLKASVGRGCAAGAQASGAVMGGVAASRQQLPGDRPPKVLTSRCGIYGACIAGLVPFLCTHESLNCGLRESLHLFDECCWPLTGQTGGYNGMFKRRERLISYIFSKIMITISTLVFIFLIFLQSRFFFSFTSLTVSVKSEHVDACFITKRKVTYLK